MDWNAAIERYHERLLGIIVGLYAMIGLAEGGSVEQISRSLYRKVLALLRPAESAVRRLIIVMARGIEITPSSACRARKRPAGARKGKGKSKSRRSFALCDPRLKDVGFVRRGAKGPEVVPRITFFHGDSVKTLYFGPTPQSPAPKPEPDDTVNAMPLCRRLDAIRRALQDLAGQAQRYARWLAKPVEERRPKRETALRRGPPPGLKRKSSHEVHDILSECQWLAHFALKPDTS